MIDMGSCGWHPEKTEKVIQPFLVLLYNHNRQHTDIHIWQNE